MVQRRSPGRSALPVTLPIFPLAGAIVLPHLGLPLNVFEPRYLTMVDDAMRGGRLIGMVQPMGAAKEPRPNVHAIGGLGRITEWAENEDGTNHIMLTGLCRFRIVEEVACTTPYRQVKVRYDEFAHDFNEIDGVGGIDRAELGEVLKRYLAARQLEIDWNAFETTPLERIIDSFVMSTPFEPAEKQLLLETPQAEERGRILMTLLNMAVRAPGEPKSTLQ